MRSNSDTKFCNGDSVYFFKNESDFWHGPAKVVGTDGKQNLVKQGGNYYRVHPCKMSHVQTVDFPGPESAKPTNTEDVTTSAETISEENSPQISIESELEPVIPSVDLSDIPDAVIPSPPDFVTVHSKSDLPSVSSHISYRLYGEDDWNDGFVESRGGKIGII